MQVELTEAEKRTMLTLATELRSIRDPLKPSPLSRPITEKLETAAPPEKDADGHLLPESNETKPLWAMTVPPTRPVKSPEQIRFGLRGFMDLRRASHGVITSRQEAFRARHPFHVDGSVWSDPPSPPPPPPPPPPQQPQQQQLSPPPQRPRHPPPGCLDGHGAPTLDVILGEEDEEEEGPQATSPQATPAAPHRSSICAATSAAAASAAQKQQGAASPAKSPKPAQAAAGAEAAGAEAARAAATAALATMLPETEQPRPVTAAKLTPPDAAVLALVDTHTNVRKALHAAERRAIASRQAATQTAKAEAVRIAAEVEAATAGAVAPPPSAAATAPAAAPPEPPKRQKLKPSRRVKVPKLQDQSELSLVDRLEFAQTIIFSMQARRPRVAKSSLSSWQRHSIIITEDHPLDARARIIHSMHAHSPCRAPTSS